MCRGQSQDAPEIVFIHTFAWKKAYKNIIPDSILVNKTVTPERIQKMNDNYIEKGRLFIVKENEKILGFVTLASEIKSTIELDIFYIHPDYQRKGVGCFLLKNLLQVLKKKNVSKVIIWTLKEVKTSNAFYQKMGGILTGNIKHWYDGLYLVEFEFDLKEINLF